MEMFFCESCGHRVTDAEIESGQGVRVEDGVYCAECARVAGISAAKTAAERPSAARRERKPRRRPATSVKAPPVGGAGTMLPAVLVGGAVFAGVLLAFYLMSRRGEGPEEPERRAARRPPAAIRRPEPKEVEPIAPLAEPPPPRVGPPEGTRVERPPPPPAAREKTPRELSEERKARGELPQPKEPVQISSTLEGYRRPDRPHHYWDFEAGLGGWGNATWSAGGIEPGKKCIVLKGGLSQAWGKEYRVTERTCIQFAVCPGESFQGLQVHCFDENAQDNARYKVGRSRLTPGKWTVVRVRCVKLWFWSSGEGVPAVAAGHELKSVGISVTGEAAVDEVCVFEEE